MGNPREKTLLLFQSVHEVLAAERCLQEASSQVDVVPVPKEISSNCGVALEVVPQQLKTTIQRLHRGGLKPVGVYIRVGKEYVPWESP